MDTDSNPSTWQSPWRLEPQRPINMLIRQQIFSFWRGPRNIKAVIDADTNFWGWQTLALDMRIDRDYNPEARVTFTLCQCH